VELERLLLDPASGNLDRNMAVGLQAGDRARGRGALAITARGGRLRLTLGGAVHAPFRLDALALQIALDRRHAALGERLVVAAGGEAIGKSDSGDRCGLESRHLGDGV